MDVDNLSPDAIVRRFREAVGMMEARCRDDVRPRPPPVENVEPQPMGNGSASSFITESPTKKTAAPQNATASDASILAGSVGTFSARSFSADARSQGDSSSGNSADAAVRDADGLAMGNDASSVDNLEPLPLTQRGDCLL